jgi:hypothetical protein
MIRSLPLLLLLSLPLFTQAQDTIARRIILIGDAGELHQDGHNPVVDAVRKQFNMQDTKNTVLFLGDNVYPLGMPAPTSPRYAQSQQIIDYQVNLVRDQAARAIFVPGNHDWEKSKPDGWQTILNEGHYVDSLNLPNVDFLPKEGCPGPVEVPLDNNVTLVIMDTEWWLFPYNKPGAESDCDCKTKEDVLTAVSDIVMRNRNKLLIFASHHPFRSYSVHGGYYTIKQHIFPFTDLKKNLYIPLPILGSIYPLTRGVFGTPEDLPNPQYQAMVHGIEAAFKPHGPTIFVSGHDHTLQLIEDKQNVYVISGSGAKENRVKKGSKSLFASNENGFAAIEVSMHGAINVKYYTVDKGETPIFAQSLFSLQDIHSQALANLGTPAKELPAKVTVPIDTQYEHKSNFHEWLLGANYRNVWATPVAFPVLDLQKEKGGLTILQRGGGMQTLSLRMEDANGKEWVLRSLKKYPVKAIPEELRNTVAQDVVQDQISAADPYAPLAVPVLAKAAGVPHAKPRLVYVPKDTTLGVYASTFGDDVYLFEQREPDTKGKSINTLKVLDQIHGDNDNTTDQKATLTARLLDWLMADWDRHDDQWRWANENSKDDKTKLYYPIPRDRDQAFFVNQGVIPRIAARRWVMPNIQGFNPYIRYIQGQNPSAQPFDRDFLNGLDEKQWKAVAERFVSSITDTVIAEAVSKFPDTIRAQVGTRTYTTLKARRDILVKESLKFYRFISKDVEVTGSKKNELFAIERQPGGHVSLTVNKISKKGEVEQTIYQRVFDPAVTNEVRIFGMGGSDRFVISGDEHTPIRLRIVGGKDDDTYIDSSHIHAGAKIRIYERANGKDSFELQGHERKILSNDPANIAYERTPVKRIYDKLMPLATGGFNSDDGVSLGVGFQFIGQGFRKDPFAVRHTLTVSHSLATKAWQFKYLGEFTDIIGHTDLTLGVTAKAPNNTINFFGYGNETVFDKSRTIKYYRTRFSLYSVEPLLHTKLSPHFQVIYGPTFNAYMLDKDENNNRIITDFAHNGLDSASVVTNKTYVGLKAGFEVDTRNNPVMPTRGFYWNTTLHGNQGLNEDQHHYLQLMTDMSLYTSFTDAAGLVLVTRFGGGKIWGHYEYFQALTLGGIYNLRGFRNFRFSGDGMAFNNTEVRLKLFEFRSYLFPATVGLLAFNDVGRVWVKGESSSVWHDGYGGGFYVSPVNMLLVSLTVGRSPEETLPYITLGTRFKF